MAGLRFPKSARLLNSDEYNRVFRQAKLRVSHPLLLILASSNGLDWPRLGLVIPKKHIRLATQRNRVKRRLRETFRAQQHQLPAIDAIVLARGPVHELNDSELNDLCRQQWQRLRRKFEREM